MHKWTLLAGAAACLMSSPVMAQDQGAAPAETASQPAPTVGLSDIVVTATKRATNLQNVPVAVTAMTSETIASKRIGAFSDLTRAAASLTLTESTAAPNNSIILRGIGTYALSIGVEPSVAVIIDDVPVVQQAQAFDNLSDVERIEVLRGPQGTLFGKNASAGAINIVTRDVANHLEGSGSVTGTTDGGYKGEASISDKLDDNGSGFRITGYYNNWRGNVLNITDGKMLNDNESWGIRAKVKYNIGGRLTVHLAGGYSGSHSNGTAGTVRYVDLTTVGAAGRQPGPYYNGQSIASAFTGITPGAANRVVRQDNDSFTDSKQWSLSGKLNYDLGFANLMSITSYQDWKYNFSADVDGTDLAVNNGATAVTNPIGPSKGVNNSGPYHSTSITQEVRLTSKTAGPLSYVLGAFYANSASNRSFTRGPALILANWYGYSGTRSLAAFAGVDYKLPTKTTISAAARVNNERVHGDFINMLPSANTTQTVINANCGIGATGCDGRHTDTVATWKVSVSQELAPRVSTYASVATGYKGYAYDISSGFTPARVNGTDGPVKAEHSTAYEIGLKSRFLDNKVQLNVAGFWTDYNNFQAQSSQYLNGAIQQKLNNVGKLRTKGVEVEAQARPTDWLHFDASAAYTDAKIVSFTAATCYSGQTAAQGCINSVQDRSGADLPNSPKFKFNLGTTIDHHLDADSKATLTLNYQHQSAINFDLLGNPLMWQKAYGIFNAAIGFERGHYKASLFVNNLLNQHYASGMADNFGSYGVHEIVQIVSRDADRYAGIKLSAQF
ncbi:TonB-dependent receptor [Novosphingobium terrae]|uniref:TonB-dependent receptor n=1 Tax=Novosphingobium terrae TaxID=2726189 RepID=UPI00197F6394|nr:TonB-dependent receptor [Novosphingobium terrae]